MIFPCFGPITISAYFCQPCPTPPISISNLSSSSPTIFSPSPSSLCFVPPLGINHSSAFILFAFPLPPFRFPCVYHFLFFPFPTHPTSLYSASLSLLFTCWSPLTCHDTHYIDSYHPVLRRPPPQSISVSPLKRPQSCWLLFIIYQFILNNINISSFLSRRLAFYIYILIMTDLPILKASLFLFKFSKTFSC